MKIIGKMAITLSLVLAATAWQAGADAASRLEKATFAGGCFWCMEPPFEKLAGVREVISGYTGGGKANPSYEEVSAGGTGHIEAVQILYDPSRVTYRQLLDRFWREIDPTDAEGQFVDRGPSYTAAIFYHSEEQRRLAEDSKKSIAESGRFDKPIVTAIRPAGPFYRAEEYHQDYHKKNPLRYNYYRYRSGRDAYLEKVWGKEVPMDAGKESGTYKIPSKAELKKKLSALQYSVTQQEGTEPAFNNPYWNNYKAGIYVDIVSGEPLFSSQDQYDSGTGWPSFTRPLEPGNLVEREDRSWFGVRTEIRSRHADSHLGHVFNDGPPPTGLRYCMNSAAMRFIPKEELEKEGYGRYLQRFTQK